MVNKNTRLKFKMQLNCALLFLSILTGQFSLKAQSTYNEEQITDSINRLAYTINFGENDIIKLNANEFLIETLYNVLITKESRSFLFDSIKNISYLAPEDKSFRMFTWAIKKEDGTYESSGVLQTYNPKTNRAVIFTLKDKSAQYYTPENILGDVDNWFGAIYYKVLPSTINKKKYYTLLGWSGCNNLKQRKVIEVLSFRANGTPVFGSKIFKKYTNKTAMRVVFEYSKQASMTLNYDKQTYYLSTGKRDPKTKRMISKAITADMIVFDRLAPLNESMAGVPEFYVPETNIIDAFITTHGRWTYVQDIEARNHVKKSEKKPKAIYDKRIIYKKAKKI